MTIEPLYSLAGVLVGVLVGLTGVGGGSLMTPILVLAFGFHPATAVGTDLLYAAATKTVGTTVHGWRGTLDWSIVRRLAMGSVPTTIVTLLLLGQASEHSSATQHLLATLLGVVLVVSAVATLLRHRIVAALTPRLGETDGREPVALTVLLGAILGVLVSLTSVGAGALGMTALLVLYPRHPLKKPRRRRHRACRAANAAGGHRPLAARFGRSRPARIAADRIDPGHRRRQPAGGRNARGGAASGAGDRPRHRRGQAAAVSGGAPFDHTATRFPPAATAPASVSRARPSIAGKSSP